MTKFSYVIIPIYKQVEFINTHYISWMSILLELYVSAISGEIADISAINFFKRALLYFLFSLRFLFCAFDVPFHL